MDFFFMLILAVIIFICGVICTLFVEYFLFKKYLENGPVEKPPAKPLLYEKSILPDELLNEVKDEKNFKSLPHMPQTFSQGNEILAINLTLQFLFNELKNAEHVRLWLYKKLNREFKKLKRTVIGRIFDSVQLKDLNLGTQAPTIKGVKVAKAVINHDTGLLETLKLLLDLHYSGDFQVSIDMKMLLGKAAYLSLKVKRLYGKVCLQFTRIPYTHWSLSFCDEPIIDFEAHSQFQGRYLKPQFALYITEQIRHAIRRKHVYSWHKMRHGPFFRKLNDNNIDLSEVASSQSIPGLLDVELIEVSRLNLTQYNLPCDDTSQIEIYCIMSTDTIPYLHLIQYGSVPYIVLDLTVNAKYSERLGAVLKQEIVPEIRRSCVFVEEIVPGSPASIAKMCKGDILVKVDGEEITSASQVDRIIKDSFCEFVIRVERKYNKIDSNKYQLIDKTYLNVDKKLRNDSKDIKDHGKLIKDNTQYKYSDLKDQYDNDSVTSTPEHGDSGIKLFRRRKSSIQVSDDHSQHGNESLSHRILTNSINSLASSTRMIINDDPLTINLNDIYLTTKELNFASTIFFNEAQTLQIDSEFQYLNVGVYAKHRSGDFTPKILGYVNVPVKLILAQCSTSATGHYLKLYPLLPFDKASSANLNSEWHKHRDFDPNLCYGDVLLSYGWISTNENLQNTTNDSKKCETQAINKNILPNVISEFGDKKHDFTRTHVHRVNCNFCSKKIWLKDAVQCRDCDMVCHIKCETRCQSSGICSAESSKNVTLKADESESNFTADSSAASEI